MIVKLVTFTATTVYTADAATTDAATTDSGTASLTE